MSHFIGGIDTPFLRCLHCSDVSGVTMCLHIMWPSVMTAESGLFFMMDMLNGLVASFTPKWPHNRILKYYHTTSNIIYIHNNRFFLSLFAHMFSCSLVTQIKAPQCCLSLWSRKWLATSASCPRAGTAPCVWEWRFWDAQCQVRDTGPPLTLKHCLMLAIVKQQKARILKRFLSTLVYRYP